MMRRAWRITRAGTQSSIRRRNLACRRRGRCPGGSVPNMRSLSGASRLSASVEQCSQTRLASKSLSGRRRRLTPSFASLMRSSICARSRWWCSTARLSDLLCVRSGLVDVLVGESVSEVDLEGSEGVWPAVGSLPGRLGSHDREVDELGGGLLVGEVSAGLDRLADLAGGGFGAVWGVEDGAPGGGAGGGGGSGFPAGGPRPPE